MCKFLISLMMLVNLTWAEESMLQVTKNVTTSLPKMIIEDSGSVTDSQKFHAMLAADINVVSLFDLDSTYKSTPFNAPAGDSGYVLRYRLSPDSAGGYSADVKLLQNNAVLFSKNYVLRQREMAVFLSHSIAYDINAKMGGAPLEWMKRKVIFVRLGSPRHADIVVADYTLAYQKVVLSGGMYGFAKWANREQTEFYYTSLSDFRPTIYKYNLQSGQKTKLISSDGMAVCSDVSEDGGKLLLTLAPGGQPDVYLYNVATMDKTRVTDYSGIDVNGQFMGNDTIAFVSNRTGNPNIYSKKISGSAISQIVFEGNNNSSCTTYRNWVVYKTRENGGSNLHLVSLNGGGVRRLTNGGSNDYPRFSHDGEAILFIKQEGHSSLLGILRLGLNRIFTFPLRIGNLQSIDW
jgi:TolB protein